MNILIACEFSGIVRDAFRARGHDAMSCDLLPTERPGPHYQGDVLELLHEGWDLMIGHPPCTYLANSANKHLYINKRRENGRDDTRWGLMGEGAEFFLALLDAPIPKVCIENPIMGREAKALIGWPHSPSPS